MAHIYKITLRKEKKMGKYCDCSEQLNISLNYGYDYEWTLRIMNGVIKVNSLECIRYSKNEPDQYWLIIDGKHETNWGSCFDNHQMSRNIILRVLLSAGIAFDNVIFAHAVYMVVNEYETELRFLWFLFFFPLSVFCVFDLFYFGFYMVYAIYSFDSFHIVKANLSGISVDLWRRKRECDA